MRDNETGQVWERSPATSTTTWSAAISHCATREVGGRKGWSLPMREQLASLVDTSNSNPALPTSHPFLTALPASYWSATTDVSEPQNSWYVNFSNGFVFNNAFKGIFNPAWCVRGGQTFDGNTHSTLH